MKTITHMARDQYGQYYHDLGPNPRKALLDRFGRKHADKMYVDKKSGGSAHIGYIISGLWLTIFKVEHWEKPA
jgi:hypothetical protein